MKQLTKAEFVLSFVETHRGCSGALALGAWDRYCRDLLRSRDVLADEINEDPPAEVPSRNQVLVYVSGYESHYSVHVCVNGVVTLAHELRRGEVKAIRKYLGEP